MDISSQHTHACDALLHAEAALDACSDNEAGDWLWAIMILDVKCEELEHQLWDAAVAQ